VVVGAATLNSVANEQSSQQKFFAVSRGRFRLAFSVSAGFD
jgi:hypothetical protein